MLWCLRELQNKKLIGTIEDRLKIFLSEYGEKGKVILKVAVERMKELDLQNMEYRFGDFDYKGIKQKLEELGVNYNPSTLLRIMERDYAIIETVYRSSNQRWWKFYDREAVQSFLHGTDKEMETDKDLVLIKAMYASLEPENILKELTRINSKRSIDYIDKKIFKKLVFEDSEKISILIDKMSERKSYFEKELEVLRKIIELVDIISNKLIKENF